MNVRWKRLDGIEFARYRGELVIINREGEVIRGLNANARFIWERLEDEPTLIELAQCVSQRFSLDPERAFADTRGFVAICRQAGLVQPMPDADGSEA